MLAVTVARARASARPLLLRPCLQVCHVSARDSGADSELEHETCWASEPRLAIGIAVELQVPSGNARIIDVRRQVVTTGLWPWPVLELEAASNLNIMMTAAAADRATPSPTRRHRDHICSD